MKKLFLFLFILFFTTQVESKYRIRKIGIEQGLSGNFVMSITQDSKGYLWIATKTGLNRFDGNKFKVFKANGSQNQINSNELNKVVPVGQNTLWIPTERTGINIYNYETNQFTYLNSDWNMANENQISSTAITDVVPDKMGNVWIVNYQSGVDYYDFNTNRFSHFNHTNVKGWTNNVLWCLNFDNKGTLYLGHVYGGLSVVDVVNRTSVNYSNKKSDPTSLPGDEVRVIFVDSNGRIWIGTNNGLALFNPVKKNFIVFKNDKANSNSLSDNFIQTITQTSDGRIWIGTSNGINILDYESEAFTNPQDVNFEHIPIMDTPQGLSGNSITSIFQDNFDNIWIGTKSGGVNFIPAKSDFFQSISYLPIPGNSNSLSGKIVNDLAVTSDDNLWVATQGGGLDVYQGTRKIKNFKFDDFTDVNNTIVSVHADKKDKVWIGTDNAFVAYKGVNDLDFKDVGINRNSGHIVFDFADDIYGYTWVATNRGLFRYSDREINFYQTSSGISDNVIRSVAADQNGLVWLGTLGGGLNLFSKEPQVVKYFPNSQGFMRINDIYIDSKGRKWIGTKDHLICFDKPESDQFILYDLRNGFVDADFRTIVEGRNADDIWVATASGLSLLQVNTGKVYNFNQNDGLPFSEYMIGSGARTKTGKVFFGTQNGITFFDSNQGLPKFNIPNVIVSDFLVVDKRNPSSQDSSIVLANDKIELEYFQNTFNVMYNVLDYALSGKVFFSYKMEGLSDSWYDVKGEKQLTFRDLRPGSYTLKIRAGHRNQTEMTKITELKIEINPPFWLSWWAKTVYLLFFVFLGFYIIRFYKRKFDLENSLYLEKQNHEQEQILNDERLKFFTNITHELRTPLSLIVGPIEDLISDKSMSNPQKKKLNSIHKSAFRLLELINQILEFRKSETHHRKLNVVKSSISDFVKELVLKYMVLNQNKDLEMSFDIDERAGEIYFDAEVMTIILDNLISNALKYTPKGVVKISLQDVEVNNVQYTQIRIKDTGIGIQADQLTKIFDRYYQVKGDHKVSGTGIGLSLVKNLAELHEALIQVESEVGSGSEFILSLISDNIYPDALHMDEIDKAIKHPEMPGQQKLSMLIVEDNSEILDYIEDCFSESFEILKAENGKEGIEIALSKVPDIIISDIMMPIMDGKELCSSLKNNVNTSHIPIILLTAKDTIQDKTEGYQVGADSYVTKPFSASLLRSRVDNLLETRKRMNDLFASKTNFKQSIMKESINKIDNDFISKYVEIVEENLENESFNVDQISDRMFMSHSTLYRKIKSLTGLSPNEFVRKIRMLNAEKILITRKYSVSEIMVKVGMSSPAYFRQCFRDEFGVTPTEYIQNLKKEK